MHERSEGKHILVTGGNSGIGLTTARHFISEAVPDLSLSVERAWVVDNQVISHLHFSGHFSGSFAGRMGDGRAISFDAVDIYTIQDGRIKPTDIWKTTWP